LRGCAPVVTGCSPEHPHYDDIKGRIMLGNVLNLTSYANFSLARAANTNQTASVPSRGPSPGNWIGAEMPNFDYVLDLNQPEKVITERIKGLIQFLADANNSIKAARDMVKHRNNLTQEQKSKLSELDSDYITSRSTAEQLINHSNHPSKENR
jgi:hypothetical protein